MQRQPNIRLKKPRWEALAIKIAGGMTQSGAYAELYPSCKTPANSCGRLLRNNPMIRDRVNEIIDHAEEKVSDKIAMTADKVEDALLENIEHAKSFGKVIRDKRTGDIISCERNHSAINQGLKIIADVRGMTVKAKQERGRGADDPDVELTAEQLLASVLRRYAEARGMKIDKLTQGALGRIAAVAGARLPVGEDPAAEIEVLRPVSETE